MKFCVMPGRAIVQGNTKFLLYLNSIKPVFFEFNGNYRSFLRDIQTVRLGFGGRQINTFIKIDAVAGIWQ
jgi:hypothetical protein